MMSEDEKRIRHQLLMRSDPYYRQVTERLIVPASAVFTVKMECVETEESFVFLDSLHSAAGKLVAGCRVTGIDFAPRAKMEWTKEKPKEPGYYWMRSVRCFGDKKARPVEVDTRNAVWFLGNEVEDSLSEHSDAEWQGPIVPDEA